MIKSTQHLILIFFLTASSCDKASDTQTLKQYFDLTAFMNNQVEKLTKDSVVIIKTSSINDKIEQHTVKWVDWKKEFALLYASDINKESFAGKYEVDTVIKGNSDSLIVSYTALDKNLKTQLLKITSSIGKNNNGHENPVVTSILIMNQSSGFLASTIETIHYLPFEGYIISSATETKFVGLNNFAVRGEFVKNEQPKYFQ